MKSSLMKRRFAKLKEKYEKDIAAYWATGKPDRWKRELSRLKNSKKKKEEEEENEGEEDDDDE